MFLIGTGCALSRMTIRAQRAPKRFFIGWVQLYHQAPASFASLSQVGALSDSYSSARAALRSGTALKIKRSQPPKGLNVTGLLLFNPFLKNV